MIIEDAPSFRSEASGEFESVLVSRYPMEETENGLVIRGEHGTAAVTPSRGGVRVEHLEDAFETSDHERQNDVWRARIADGLDSGESIRLRVDLSSR